MAGLKVDRLVRDLALAIFLQWAGASAVLPLLPLFLRRHGGSDVVVGVVMGSYFVAALAAQYPAGRLADRIGRRPVLLGGLALYALGSLGFLLPIGPMADVAARVCQGVGAGGAEVAALAMISGTVALAQRGRAFGAIYAGQVGGLAIGPLLGSLAGVGGMPEVFVAAALAAGAAGLRVWRSPAMARATGGEAQARTSPIRFERPLVGSLLCAGALGLTIGVYESCWTLLLDLRHAHNWEIGLSWTLFAAPFVAMSRPGGWLADHLDRRRLVVFTLVSSVAFCVSYPFIHDIAWLLALGGAEACGTAMTLPAAQSLLTQSSLPSQVGRVQGLYSTAETAAIAVSATAGGALFALAPWAPFVAGGSGALALAATLPFLWRHVTGKVPDLAAAPGGAAGAEVPAG